jgi:hypothetical protein
VAQAVAGVDQQRGRRLADRGDLGPGGQLAGPDAAHVVRLEPRDAVRLDAAQVRGDQDVGDDRGVLGGDPDLLQDRGDEVFEPGFGGEPVLGRDDVGHAGSVPRLACGP